MEAKPLDQKLAGDIFNHLWGLTPTEASLTPMTRKARRVLRYRMTLVVEEFHFSRTWSLGGGCVEMEVASLLSVDFPSSVFSGIRMVVCGVDDGELPSPGSPLCAVELIDFFFLMEPTVLRIEGDKLESDVDQENE